MNQPDLKPMKLSIDKQYVNRLLGVELASKDIMKLLKRMGFGVSKTKRAFEVSIPPFRCDILHPIDLVEDIAIAYGYMNFKPQAPHLYTVGRRNPLERYSDNVRNLFIGLGFTEVVNLIMISSTALYDKMNLKPQKAVETLNPISSEHALARSWLLPSLFNCLKLNQNREYPQKLFEVGDVIDSEGIQHRKAACVSAHGKASFTEIKGIYEGLISSLSRQSKLEPVSHSSFIEGRCAQDDVGFLGEIHPLVIENFGLEMPVCAFEVDLDKAMANERQ